MRSAHCKPTTAPLIWGNSQSVRNNWQTIDIKVFSPKTLSLYQTINELNVSRDSRALEEFLLRAKDLDDVKDLIVMYQGVLSAMIKEEQILKAYEPQDIVLLHKYFDDPFDEDAVRFIVDAISGIRWGKALLKGIRAVVDIASVHGLPVCISSLILTKRIS